MKWSPTYATGISQLDEQHKHLFKMSDDYAEALRAGQGERVYPLLLRSLDDYARAHFGFEEECMYRHQCPVANANCEAHRQFLRGLQDFHQRFSVRGFKQVDARDLVRFLDSWLANHIARIDVQLKSCVEQT